MNLNSPMQKIPVAIFVILLAGCADPGVERVNSYLYQVAATRSNADSTGMEEATRLVYAEARTYCAKQERIVETDTLARFDQDLGRPGSATLRFRCVKPELSEPSPVTRN